MRIVKTDDRQDGFDTTETSDAKDAVAEIVRDAYEYLGIDPERANEGKCDPIDVAEDAVERLIGLRWRPTEEAEDEAVSMWRATANDLLGVIWPLMTDRQRTAYEESGTLPTLAIGVASVTEAQVEAAAVEYQRAYQENVRVAPSVRGPDGITRVDAHRALVNAWGSALATLGITVRYGSDA